MQWIKGREDSVCLTFEVTAGLEHLAGNPLNPLWTEPKPPEQETLYPCDPDITHQNSVLLSITVRNYAVLNAVCTSLRLISCSERPYLSANMSLLHSSTFVCFVLSFRLSVGLSYLLFHWMWCGCWGCSYPVWRCSRCHCSPSAVDLLGPASPRPCDRHIQLFIKDKGSFLLLHKVNSLP